MGEHKVTYAGGVTAGPKVQHRGSTLSPSLQLHPQQAASGRNSGPFLSSLHARFTIWGTSYNF